MLHNQLLGCKDRYLMDIESVNARSEAHLIKKKDQQNAARGLSANQTL
jgi:hypothetical protein